MVGFFSKGDKQNPWIARGEQAFEKQQFEEACSHYVRAAEAEPKNLTVLLRLAHLQQYTGKFTEAAATYQNIVAEQPENTEAWLQLALLQGESGKFADAVESIEHVPLTAADNFYLARKSEWISRTGNFRYAAEIAKQLVTAAPENEYYSSLYADNLMRAGQIAEAKAVYQDLMKTYPDHAGKYANEAGLCAELLNLPEEAQEAYAALPAGDTLGKFRKARIEEANGRFADAAASYSELAALTGIDELHLAFRRAYALVWSGAGKEAVTELEKLIAKNRNSYELWYLLGSAQFMNGNLKKSAESLTEAIRCAPASPWLWQMKGTAEFFCGEYSKAITSLGRAKAILSGKATGDALFEGSGMELIEKNKTPIENIKFSQNRPDLAAIEAVCLAAAGKSEAADNAALTALEADPSRIDMELLHLRLLASAGRYQAAAEAYDRVAEILPDDYTLLYEHAETEMLLGNFSQAAELFRTLSETYPGNTMLQCRLITCLANTGDIAAAKDAVDEVVGTMPETPETLRVFAQAAYSAGDYAAAAASYQRLTELQPNNGDAFLGLGKSSEMLGRYSEAKQALESAAALLEENMGIVFLQALCAADGGNLAEAASLYEDIIRVCPTLQGPASELALISAALGRHEQTETAVKLAIDQGNASYSLYKLGGDACMQMLKYSEAIAYYRDALELKPGDPAVTIALGRAYTAKGAYKEALDAFNMDTADETESSALLLAKAQCKSALGRWEDAETDLRTLAERDPENPEVLLSLAEAQERQMKYADQLETYAAYLEIQPDNFQVFRKVAALYLTQGDYEEAIDGYDMILEAQPDDTLTMRQKAEALMTLGRWQEAADTCKAILDRMPDDPNLRMLYARALRLAGNTAGAMEQYAVVLKADRTNTEALLNYGDMLSSSGNYPKAMIAFDRVIKGNAKNYMAYLSRSNAALMEGNPETILASLKSSLSAADGNPYMLAGLGYMAARIGRPSEAVTLLEKAAKAGCTDVDMYSTLAQIYLNQSKFETALEYAEKGTQTAPENTVAWRMKAKALESLGRLEEAVDAYRNAIAGKKPSAEPAPAAEEDEEDLPPAKPVEKPAPKYDDDMPAFEDIEEEKQPMDPMDDEPAVFREPADDIPRKSKSSGQISSSSIKDELSMLDPTPRKRRTSYDDDPYGSDRKKEEPRKRGIIIN